MPLCLRLAGGLGRPESSACWPPHVAPLVTQGLQHNLVWRSGRVAGTVRKVALVCLHGLLHRGYADRKALFQVNTRARARRITRATTSSPPPPSFASTPCWTCALFVCVFFKPRGLENRGNDGLTTRILFEPP